MFTIEMLNLMWTGLLETLYMTLISAVLSYVLGLPLLHLFRKRIPEKYYK